MAGLPTHTPNAQTEQPSPIQMTSLVGLDGYCLSEQWVPVRVTLENTGTDLDGQVEVQVNNGLNQWNFAQAVSLPSVSRKEVTLYAYLYGSPNNIQISFVSDEGVVATTTQNIACLQTNSQLVGLWTSTPSIYNILTTLIISGARPSTAVLEIADFPTHPEGLDMLQMIIISDVDTGTLSDLQRQALSSWVANGGRLLVAGGAGWQKTVSGVADLLPVVLSGSVTVNELGGLLEMAPQADPLTGDTVLATGAPREGAEILAVQEDIPLIVRQKFGFGEVFFFAFDPALAPLRNWTGLEVMYQTLFVAQRDVPTWANGYVEWTEASSAVSNVPGLGLPSIFLICGFLGLYTLALGPLNYLVLRKLKRRELAWITIPVLVVLFSCGAFVLGLFVRGTRSVINNLAIVQVWPEVSQARVHGLVGVFSPNRNLYNVELNGNFVAHPLVNFGLGGSGEWGILHNEEKTVVPDLRIDAGGIEGVVVEGDTPAPAFVSDVHLEFGASGLTIDGEVQNNSELTLHDVILLAPGQAQELGEFGPGKALAISLVLSNTGIASPNGNTTGYPYYGYYADTTFQDVFGTTNVNSSFDQDLRRRYSMLQAAMGYGGTRGSGLYLLGWTDSSPLNVTLDGKGFKNEATSIYIIALNPTIESTASVLTLPPAMFAWDRLENSTNLDFSPYNSYLYEGEYNIHYKLSQPIPYQTVKALTLHLTDYGNTGQHNLNIALWDFTRNEWTPIDCTMWGDFEVPDPARFVGTGGTIQLQIINPNQISIDLERAD
ncbi:MAG: hypothetical protein HUU38_29725, partial [Anaerolineales bacterium]|nr:hypothetical protein [Anaerolineales bacterium]